jgi:hypothetical protein
MGRQTQDRKKLIIPDFQGSLPATLSDIVAPSQRAAGERLLVRVETLAYSPALTIPPGQKPLLEWLVENPDLQGF